MFHVDYSVKPSVYMIIKNTFVQRYNKSNRNSCLDQINLKLRTFQPGAGVSPSTGHPAPGGSGDTSKNTDTSKLKDQTDFMCPTRALERPGELHVVTVGEFDAHVFIKRVTITTHESHGCIRIVAKSAFVPTSQVDTEFCHIKSCLKGIQPALAFIDDTRIDDVYYKQWLPTLNTCLEVGGVRLAALLNDALDPGAAKDTSAKDTSAKDTKGTKGSKGSKNVKPAGSETAPGPVTPATSPTAPPAGSPSDELVPA